MADDEKTFARVSGKESTWVLERFNGADWQTYQGIFVRTVADAVAGPIERAVAVEPSSRWRLVDRDTGEVLWTL